MKRREQTRYGLCARVDFKWTDEKGMTHVGRGYTRDISSKGMFIHAAVQPPERAPVQIEVFFSSLVEVGSTLRMRAKARVVRVEPPGGFAAVSRSYVLHDGVASVEE